MSKSQMSHPVKITLKERQFLTVLGDKVRRAIKQGSADYLPLRDSIHNTSTGGIRTSIARAKQTRLELWHDQYAQHPKLRLWYGYYWPSWHSFNAAFGHWREYVQREFVRWDSDATSTIPYHFKRNLQPSEFGRPFLEHYRSSDEFFFGCFDLRSKVSTSLIGDISKFFHLSLTSQSTIEVGHIYPRKTKHLEKLEVQRLTKALVFDRSSPVAKERKKRDGYKCHICGFDFALVYPGLGSKFAEAHHIEPLGRAKKAKVRVRISNLRTLCSNCHRMVHRAESKLGGNPIVHVRNAWKKGRRGGK
jgi:hypothetical protein